jgi:hypothetical protein
MLIERRNDHLADLAKDETDYNQAACFSISRIARKQAFSI